MSRMPQVTSTELLHRQGFRDRMQEGSHLTLVGRGRRVTIPMHGGRDLGRGIALKVLRDAGFSVDDYLRLR